MKTETVIFPIDLTKCPLAAFAVVNAFVNLPGAMVTLLHVVNLNILAPVAGLYDDICCEAERHLEWLRRKYVNPAVATRVRVRMGKTLDEIMAEATESGAKLILLPTFEPPAWKRFFLPLVPKTVEKLVQNASCPVFVVREEKPGTDKNHRAALPSTAVLVLGAL